VILAKFRTSFVDCLAAVVYRGSNIVILMFLFLQSNPIQ